jgi:hypothetical protein
MCPGALAQICNTDCFSTVTIIREGASTLCYVRYTYIACLVRNYSLQNCNRKNKNLVVVWSLMHSTLGETLFCQIQDTFIIQVKLKIFQNRVKFTIFKPVNANYYYICMKMLYKLDLMFKLDPISCGITSTDNDVTVLILVLQQKQQEKYFKCQKGTNALIQ